MDPFISPGVGSVIGAGIQAGSGILGGILGSQGQQATNAQQMAFAEQQQNQAENFNAQQAAIGRGWTEYMQATSYDRAMSSMRQAGLNPILAANLGGLGASGGATGSISGVSTTLGNPGAALQAGVASAGQAAATGAMVKTALTQADKDASQTDLNKASEDLAKKQGTRTEQETATSKAAEDLNKAATVKTAAEAANKVYEGAALQGQANSANALARVNTRIAEDAEKYGASTWGSGIASVMRLLNTAGGSPPSSAVDLKSRGISIPAGDHRNRQSAPAGVGAAVGGGF